jgi:hypothetical protein
VVFSKGEGVGWVEEWEEEEERTIHVDLTKAELSFKGIRCGLLCEERQRSLPLLA